MNGIVSMLMRSVLEGVPNTKSTVKQYLNEKRSSIKLRKRRHRLNNKLLGNQETYRPLIQFGIGFPTHSLRNKPLRDNVVRGRGKTREYSLIFRCPCKEK